MRGSFFLSVLAGLEATLSANDIELYPSGDRVVAAVDYTVSHPGWTSDGRLYLAGEPILDSERQVFHVEDFDYVLDTWDRSIAGTAVLLHSGLRESVAERLHFPLGERLEAARAAANEGLRLGKPGKEPGTVVHGGLSTLALQGLRLTDEALVVDALATGSLVMTRFEAP